LRYFLNDEKLSPGVTLNLPRKFFEVKNGDSCSEIIVYDNAYCAVGYACSSGYREYKSSDGYQNDVIAFVFEKLADCTKGNGLRSGDGWSEQDEIPVTNGHYRTYGTFLVDGYFLGLDQSVIVEAVEGTGITRLPESGKSVKGIIEYRGQYVPVLDMHTFGQSQAGENEDCNLLLIRQKDGMLTALMVDQLVNVLEIGEKYILPAPG
jgi:hypothetical protein